MVKLCLYLCMFSAHPLPDGSPRVRWAASSMRNAFGMRLVNLFFNIPFLCLQRETLKRQLERNREEVLSSYTELDCYQETPDADYDTFIEAVTQHRRQLAENQGARPSAVTPTGSGRVMGGGQPIPGQQISPHRAKPPPGTGVVSTATSVSSYSPNQSSVTSDRKHSFEMVGDDDGIDQFLGDEPMAAPSERASHSVRPNRLELRQGSDDDSHSNGMVKTFEQDFESDDDLQERMNRVAETKKVESATRKKLRTPEPPCPVITPPAYRTKLDDDAVDSSNDEEYTTPDKDESDGPIAFTASLSLEAIQPEEAPLPTPVAPIPQSTSDNFGDLDAWLCEEEPSKHAAKPAAPLPVCDSSSDEEFGVKLPPARSPSPDARPAPPKPLKSVSSPAVKLTLVYSADEMEEKPKKKKTKKPEGEKTEKKKKSKVPTDGAVDGEKKKKKATRKEDTSKSPRAERSSRSALEDFLGGGGGGELEDVADYDPL